MHFIGHRRNADIIRFAYVPRTIISLTCSPAQLSSLKLRPVQQPFAVLLELTLKRFATFAALVEPGSRVRLRITFLLLPGWLTYTTSG